MSTSLPPARFAIDSAASVLEEVAATPKQLSELDQAVERSHSSSDYLFVSNIRFLAMFSIVGVHCMTLFGIGAPPASYLQVILIQAAKFGTISFFLISGYLLGEGLTRTNRARYFQRRVSSVFVPWVFWGLVWRVVVALGQRKAGIAHVHALSRHGWIWRNLITVAVESIYWFVPNYFICLLLVLWLYKLLPDYLQGLLFLTFSVFYGLNIYLNLVPVRHTSALLGFVFYMWLGVFAYKHRDAWAKWMETISSAHLAILIAVAAAFSIGELHLLDKFRSVDKFNTLRISNQVFSVLMALLIAKSRRPLFPGWISVRLETFGIFLIHPILIQISQTTLERQPDAVRQGIDANGPLLIWLSLSTFAFVYMLSLMLTKLIRQIPFLAWTVG